MKRLLLILLLAPVLLFGQTQLRVYNPTYTVYEQPSEAGFEVEYQAVLDKGTSLGYTLPSASQQTAQNTIVSTLKTAGKWDSLDVFYVFATDGDSNFAKLNWVNPDTFAITFTGTPQFESDEGYTGGQTVGTALVTGYRPDTYLGNFDVDDCSYGFWWFDIGTGSNYLFGDFSLNLLRQSGATTRLTSASSTSITTPAVGWLSLHRGSFTQFITNHNGTFSSAINANGAGDSSGLANEIFELLNRASTNSASNATISFYYSGAKMHDNTIYNAINTYMSGL